MSDRDCIRGCVQRDVHYATCAWYGIDENVAPTVAALPNAPKQCKGCAPRECRDGSLICDRCFGRLRALVRDADDLMGRLWSLADPMKATPTDKAPGRRSSSVEPPAPVDADLLDAINEISRRLWDWESFVHPVTLEAALPELVNVVEHVEALGRGFLDRHPLVDGIREVWSVQDAVDKWGFERRTDAFVYPADEGEGEPEAAPVREWYDPLLTLQQAAKRASVSQRQVQRWVQKEVVSVVAQHRGPRGSVMKYVRASAVDAAVASMGANQQRTRYLQPSESSDPRGQAGEGLMSGWR
jgi:hypothetical protein